MQIDVETKVKGSKCALCGAETPINHSVVSHKGKQYVSCAGCLQNLIRLTGPERAAKFEAVESNRTPSPGK